MSHAIRTSRLAAIAACLFLIAAPVAEGQGQPAKQEPKVGRVKMLDTLKGAQASPLFCRIHQRRQDLGFVRLE